MSSAIFSVAVDLIMIDSPIEYDLYINSSALQGHERFVRIFPIGQTLTKSDIEEFKTKYGNIYIKEEQRHLFLQSLQKGSSEDSRKVQTLKEAAISHLEKVFGNEKVLTTPLLEETINNCRDSVESMIDVVKDYRIDELQKLISELSFHDFYTFDHSVNVCLYTIATVKAISPNADHEKVLTAGLGGLLHDLGKINIPTNIINFPGKLSDDQFQVIQGHPQGGKDLLLNHECNCRGVNLETIAQIMYQHHENYNGTGYPNGLASKDISLYARIVAVADFFDALTTQRSYHKVMTTKDALKVMSSSVGKKLDPVVFQTFAMRALHADEMEQIRTKFLKLPDNFDPCQPHANLPFEGVSEEVIKKVFSV